MKYYKVLGKDGKPCNGGNGKWFLPKGKRPGKWMPFIEHLRPCVRGYHVCRQKDLLDWINETVYLVEIRGKKIIRDDKIVVQQARLIKQMAWNETTARLFACDCARRVLSIYEKDRPDDARPRVAIETAERFARGEATREEMAAAWAAAGAAAWDAAGAAARDDESKWQTRRLMQYLTGKRRLL